MSLVIVAIVIVFVSAVIYSLCSTNEKKVTNTRKQTKNEVENSPEMNYVKKRKQIEDKYKYEDNKYKQMGKDVATLRRFTEEYTKNLAKLDEEFVNIPEERREHYYDLYADKFTNQFDKK